MPDKHPIAIGVADKQPAVSIGSTAINLSRPDSHADCSMLHNQHIGAEIGRDKLANCIFSQAQGTGCRGTDNTTGYPAWR